MEKMKAAFIGFMPRGLSLDETFDTLKKYHELGYSATEGASFMLEGDVAENRKRLEDIGMTALASHLPSFSTKTEDIKTVIDNAKKLGVKRVATYMGCVGGYRFGGRDDKPSYDEVMKELEDLNYIAKELEKEGLILTFHNHDAEFMSYYQGKPAFYLMLENSEYLKFQLDVGWVLYGHFDPIKVMKDTGDKLRSLHIKDWALNNTAHDGGLKTPEKLSVAMPTFVAPGNGMLPLARVLEQATEMNISHAIVEMDFMHGLSMADSLRSGYLNMVETGFVE